MDLLGHCEVAIRSGLHNREEVYGLGLIDLMLPNMLHCHDWAYENMWDISGIDKNLEKTALLIRSHIVADWVIHYGSNQTISKKKCGWAYKKMAIAHKKSTTFFKEASKHKLLNKYAIFPEDWNKKQMLDFSHSIIEYSIDSILAQDLSNHDFYTIKDSLQKIEHQKKEILNKFNMLNAYSDRDANFLERSIDGLLEDGINADKPDFFAISTIVRKYGFIANKESYIFIREFLMEIAENLDKVEINSILDEISNIVSNPDLIYNNCFSKKRNFKI